MYSNGFTYTSWFLLTGLHKFHTIQYRLLQVGTLSREPLYSRDRFFGLGIWSVSWLPNMVILLTAPSKIVLHLPVSQTLKTSLEKIPFENVCKCSVTTDMLNSLLSWIKGVACIDKQQRDRLFVSCYRLIGASGSNKSCGIAWIDLSWPIKNM